MNNRGRETKGGEGLGVNKEEYCAEVAGSKQEGPIDTIEGRDGRGGLAFQRRLRREREEAFRTISARKGERETALWRPRQT